MITSYRIISASQAILENQIPHLLYLIRLRLPPFRLQVNDLLNVLAGKDVMPAAHSLIKAQRFQELTQLGKRDVRVGRAPEYPFEDFIQASHEVSRPGHPAAHLRGRH